MTKVEQPYSRRPLFLGYRRRELRGGSGDGFGDEWLNELRNRADRKEHKSA